MSEAPTLPITVVRADSPVGPRDYVTCLDREAVFRRGLSAEAILGMLRRPLDDGQAIDPANFTRNPAFCDFLHRVIAERGPELESLAHAARAQGDGLVFLIDQRTPTPDATVPPEDIIGAFVVRGGVVIPGSYTPNEGHQVLTQAGFMRLEADLQACVLGALGAVPV